MIRCCYQYFQVTVMIYEPQSKIYCQETQVHLEPKTLGRGLTFDNHGYYRKKQNKPKDKVERLGQM